MLTRCVFEENIWSAFRCFISCVLTRVFVLIFLCRGVRDRNLYGEPPKRLGKCVIVKRERGQQFDDGVSVVFFFFANVNGQRDAVLFVLVGWWLIVARFLRVFVGTYL